jgi:hypothetical protein
MRFRAALQMHARKEIRPENGMRCIDDEVHGLTTARIATLQEPAQRPNCHAGRHLPLAALNIEPR